MTVSRRRFLSGSPAIAATVAATVPEPQAVVYAAGEPTLPPTEIIALNRIAYGPRPGDLDRVRGIGLQAYVDEQLNPNDADDAVCNQRLAAATLKIQYGAGTNYPAVNENRPLNALNKPLAQLWPLKDHPAFPERYRPADEVRAATWIRAAYSKWQLREVLVEFWHNHFNVDAYGDTRISATWPLYDRIMRAHCLGNFRTMLQAVAQSIAMQYYLDNAFSKDGPANENYARELFELHTLGADNYLNHLYNRWRDVPGALEGKPIGYIDQDVYEAARAFTGWTIADGRMTSGTLKLPDTGEFTYYDGWHDNAQKRILAYELDSNLPPLYDGLTVLTLLASHPGTAQFVCTKLCRRLVADTPPPALVQRAVDTWIAAKDAPDQIKQTIRTILLSPEFAATWGQKVKRPFELVAAFIRATDANFTPTQALFDQISEMGYRQFAWQPPTGHPDDSEYWLSTNVTLRRWNILLALFGSGLGAAAFNLGAQTPAGATSRQIVEFWVNRLLGRSVAPEVFAQLLDFMRQGQSGDVPPTGTADEIGKRINNLVALIGMMPDFQWR